MERSFNLEWTQAYSQDDLEIQIGTKENLATTLQSAWATVTYTSGMAVDSLLEGIPTIACAPGNFAWPVSSHSVSEINTPKREPLNQWFKDLAYCQWNIDEIEQGLPWKHLREKL